MSDPYAITKTIIHIIENQTPDEVERLRKFLILALGHLKCDPMANVFLIDAISRELGVDDLSIQRFKKEFEGLKK